MTTRHHLKLFVLSGWKRVSFIGPPLTHNYKLAILPAALLLLQVFAFSQEPATKGMKVLKNESAKVVGKTYALVTGISKYQANDTYQNLQYADADAREFYRYLINNPENKIDPANVDTLFNEQASFMEFWRKFNRIKERLQKNDIFYIYFSGHGDAYRADEAYLLAWDAPAGNDRNNYSTGVGLIDIHKLKVRIEEMTGNGTEVILITDACRSNELPGKDVGKVIAYQQIFERKAGEIQLISCASNQVSFESSKWGGGRGLFSWYLINGLKGMADTDPEDGIVTLTELYDYVKKNVNRASYDANTKSYNQTPQYCCSNFDAIVMNKVDKAEKDKVALELNKGVFTSSDKNDVAANKGVQVGIAMKAAGYEDLYKEFIKAINEGRLIEKDGAYDILKKILSKKEITRELASDLKFQLSSVLMTDVTKVINTYLTAGQNNNKYTYTYFTTAANKLKVFQLIADTLYYNPLDMEVNRLFLEGHANWNSYKTPELMECLRKVDSAVALKPQAAYLYNLKGLMHMRLHQYKQAEIALRKGIELAPNWLYPLHNLGSFYTDQGKYDSALIYYFMALKLDTNYQTSYGGIGYVYICKGIYDSAIYYYKGGLQKDSTDQYLWTQLGYAWYWQKEWNKALDCFHKSIYYDSTLVYAMEGALRVHLYNFINADSVKYYVQKMIARDPGNPIVYQSLGNIYKEVGLYPDALKMYDLSLDRDSLNPETWKDAGENYHLMKKDTAAINCYWKAWDLDSSDAFTCNLAGNSYYNLSRYDDALFLYKRAIKLRPDIALFYYNYGFVSLENKDSIAAEKYYRLAIEKKPDYYAVYYELARLKAMQLKTQEAINALGQAFKYGNYSKEYVEKDDAFISLRKNKDFLALVKKLK